MTGLQPLRERKKERTRAAIADAALRLFSARGFDAVTLVEIADAADVGHRTVFRYFSDKEELLFGDHDVVRLQLSTALAARPHREPPVRAVLEAVLELAPVWQDHREQGRRRHAVIAGSPALAARERANHRDYEDVLAEGLLARRDDPARARLLARVGVACFDEAVNRWFGDDDPAAPGLAGRIRQVFVDVAREFDQDAFRSD